jgi:hypothetical protein
MVTEETFMKVMTAFEILIEKDVATNIVTTEVANTIEDMNEMTFTGKEKGEIEDETVLVIYLLIVVVQVDDGIMMNLVSREIRTGVEDHDDREKKMMTGIRTGNVVLSEKRGIKRKRASGVQEVVVEAEAQHDGVEG